MSVFALVILTQNKNLLDEDVIDFQLKTTEGYLTVLRNHSPLIASVINSDFFITKADGAKVKGYTTGGILYVNKEKTIYVAEDATFYETKKEKNVN